MKLEEMTDEELERALGEVDRRGCEVRLKDPLLLGRQLRVHIAVLKAARDEARRALPVGLACLGDAARTTFRTLGQAADYLKRVVSERDLLASQSDNFRERALTAEGEIARLRERTRTLEKEVRAAFDCCGGSDEHPPKHTQDCDLLKSESRLASIRHCASSAVATWEGMGAASEAHGAAMERLRSSLGCVAAEPSTADAEQSLGQECGGHEIGELCGSCGNTGRMPVESSEPTTAEAFATLRKGSIPGYDQLAPARADALSLLERRMGAQEAALRVVADSGVDAQWLESGKRVRMQEVVAAALTDAPPVITLEEVEHAVWSRLGRNADAEAILSALHK